MKFSLAVSLAMLWTCTVCGITIDTVPVGDVGNPNDSATGNLYGGVNYAYNIGKYEVTVGQYAAFLNAVAATDPYGLYDTGMSTDLNVAGISRNGSVGNYIYSVIGSANHPISYVSWGDAARFANWMNNGQPKGAEGSGTTETGAYTLNGIITNGDALAATTRNAGAVWFIPTENEWYKAAYYQPAAAGGDFDGYWAYPMKTNIRPSSAPPPGTNAPDPTRVANFYGSYLNPNGYDNGWALTDYLHWSDTQNYLTDVGAYTSAPSYYGTFDQAGNVKEWNETTTPHLNKGMRGGDWDEPEDIFRASHREGFTAWFEFSNQGFRVATIIPEPGAMLLASVASIAVCGFSRRSHRLMRLMR